MCSRGQGGNRGSPNNRVEDDGCSAGAFPGDILILTLLSTPKYEFILDPDEQGVSVFWEEDEDESELLSGVERSGDEVKLTTGSDWGWTNSHLYRFQIGAKEYAEPDQDNEFYELPFRTSKRAKLGHLVTKKAAYGLTYGIIRVMAKGFGGCHGQERYNRHCHNVHNSPDNCACSVWA